MIAAGQWAQWMVSQTLDPGRQGPKKVGRHAAAVGRWDAEALS